MRRKIKSLIAKAYNRLFRKKSHRKIWGQKFDGYITLANSSNLIKGNWTTTP